MHLEISVDFTKSSVLGFNTLNMTSQVDGLASVVLDYQGMIIDSVEQYNPDTKEFVLISDGITSYDDAALGSALIIPLLYSKIRISLSSLF